MLLPFCFAYSNEVLLYQKEEIGPYRHFNPISYYFNTAFDTIQNPNYFSQKDFFSNHELVLERTLRIKRGIQEGGGISNLLKKEFFGLQAMPNYFLHLFGSGFDYRILSEWFQVHNYQHPYAWAFIVAYTAHLGNEAVESSNHEVLTAHDHIADLLFFDLISKFIFMNDEYVAFLKNEFSIASWPYQPFFNEHGWVENAGSNFILRPQIKDFTVRPFIHLGMQVLIGISHPFYQYTLSTGIGPAFTDPLKDKSRLAMGFYLDDQDQLLGSLIINGTDYFRVRLNVYPGVLKFGDLSSGFMLANSNSNDWLFGLNMHFPIGVGFRY